MAGRAAAPQDKSSLTEAAPDAAAGKANPGSAESGDASTHSGTNNHEAGVDEADLVKTDGKRLVSVVDGVLRVVDVSQQADHRHARPRGAGPARPAAAAWSGRLPAAAPGQPGAGGDQR